MTERATRRQVLAAIALRDGLPMPQAIEFQDDRLRISLENLADSQAWARVIASEVTTYDNPDGNTYLRGGYGTWLGWPVSLWAFEPTAPGGEPLDADTKAKLTAVAEGATAA